jgi:hypothetical protein
MYTTERKEGNTERERERAVAMDTTKWSQLSVAYTGRPVELPNHKATYTEITNANNSGKSDARCNRR